MAREIQVSVVADRRSPSLAKRRFRLSQASVRSIPQRLGRTLNPAGSSGGTWPGPTSALELAAKHFRPELRRAVAVGLYTGQLLRDVLKMERRHTEGEGIAIKQNKIGKGLFVPFHQALKPEIDAAHAEPGEFLICWEAAVRSRRRIFRRCGRGR